MAGTYTMPSASTAVFRPRPKVATTRTASSSAGKASRACPGARMITAVRARRRRSPAMRPSGMPTRPLTRTTTIAPRSVGLRRRRRHAPRMSRPCLSVPSRCSALGGWSDALRSWAMGSAPCNSRGTTTISSRMRHDERRRRAAWLRTNGARRDARRPRRSDRRRAARRTPAELSASGYPRVDPRRRAGP